MFFGIPFDGALCCANCCSDNTLIGAYWGFSICGGRVHITRLPEVYRAGAVFDDDGDAYSWMRTDSIVAPNLFDGSVEYKCVSGAGTQCSDAGVTRGTSYVWAQLNYAPLTDLETTQPRAALARIAVHSSNSTDVATDTLNRSATLAECWLVNDDAGDPFYWDAPEKLCGYMDLSATPMQTCVGPSHFVLEKRRVVSDNQITFWAPDVANATVVTWDNPEDTLSTTWLVAKYDANAFPMALFMQSPTFGDDFIQRNVDFGSANPANGQKVSADEPNDTDGSGNTFHWFGTWSRDHVDAPSITASNTAVYCQGFAFHGAYVSTDESEFAPFEYAETPNRTLYQGTAILQTRADVIETYTGYNRASTALTDGSDFPPGFQFLSASGQSQSDPYAFCGVAELTGSLPSVATSSGIVKRLWGFPGNSRCGYQQEFWSYSEDSDDSGLGAYIAYCTAGDVTLRTTSGTTSTLVAGEPERLYMSVWPITSVTNVPQSLEPNAGALRPFDGGVLRVLPSTYDHNGDPAGDDTPPAAPRIPRFVLEDFPLSLLIDDAIDPAAIYMGQYEYAADYAVGVDAWNLLAHPELDPVATVGIGTRWCYHWVYIDGALYPLIRINAAGKWEPREPPTGQWYDTEGLLNRSRTLCWDGHIDAKHPTATQWTP